MNRRPEPPASAPRVAVIVPAYGVAHLVGEAIDSLRAQTFAEWECVVIDDGAPDDVAAAVAPYLADRRIRFVATGNRGVAAARNRAVAATTAPYIALLDGDDLLRPDYLVRMVAALEADPAARLVTCNARIFGAVERERLCVDSRQGTGDGATGSLGDVLDRSFNVYIGSTFRRADFDRVGGFDEAMTHAEDFDFWVRLLLLGGHARYVDAVLGEYRVRPGSASAGAARMIEGNLRVYDKVLAELGEGPEAGVAHRMIAENHAALAFEQAVAQLADGDVARGLPALRAAWRGHGGRVWPLAFLLWRLLPRLAPPMMRWRQRSHSRGSAASEVPPLGPAVAWREAA
ncbi:MAG TPA: glycosyltransferase family A protein [Croceibacterium sp.]|nr:glycosyltransferase family A protein [Croceibacterium sp.]